MNPLASLYKTARWQRLRAAQLMAEPLCRMCKEERRTTAATVCDHIEPHKGDVAKFWAGPFQSLCAAHHNGAKQEMEKSGTRRGCDVNGRPYGRSDW